jgi:catalase
MESTNADTKLIEKMIELNPDHQLKTRPVHSKGLAVEAVFKASDIAKNYCIAEHFQGHEISVDVRFSNGSGSGVRNDDWSDIRGMATRFNLKDGPTDLVSMTLPEFSNSTMEGFEEFVDMTIPMLAVTRESPWAKILDYLQLKQPFPNPYPGQTTGLGSGALKFANANREAQLSVFQTSTIGAPVSYARATYHAVHTFFVYAPDGQRRPVRLTWQPAAGVKNLEIDLSNPDNPKQPCADYLNDEMQARLTSTTTSSTRFVLRMIIGEVGDSLNDPTRPWPKHRIKITMGTLTLTKVADNQDEMAEKIGFNPCRVIPGQFDISSDPILEARKHIYERSREMRGGNACPFYKAQNKAQSHDNLFVDANTKEHSKKAPDLAETKNEL